jgi:hypothetical protein
LILDLHVLSYHGPRPQKTLWAGPCAGD